MTWERADGTWAIGFWDFYCPNSFDEDFDFEWDVEYTDSFNWVSVGHSSPDAAMAEYCKTNANPGGSQIYTRTNENSAYIASLEDKLSAFRGCA